MDCEFVGKVASAPCGADGIHVADDVGDGHVRRGQLFHVALVARQPVDRRVITFGGHAFAAAAADGLQRIVVDFAPGDHRNLRVQKLQQAAQDPAFGLAAQAQQNKIVARKQGIHDLGNDRVFVAVHSGEERLVALNRPQQVAADFVLHRNTGGTGVEVWNALQLANRAGFRMSCGMH